MSNTFFMKEVGKLIGTVTKKEYITPHYIRIHLHSNDVPSFAAATIGDNNKIAIPPKGLNEVHFPEFNQETAQFVYPPQHLAPVIRTYTHRSINLDTNEIAIDFVDHGDGGPASEWARNASVGSKLGVMMKFERKELHPFVNWYLLAGDATAIPVLSAILKTLPETAKGICIIEVHGKADEQLLETKANIDFIWLHNEAPHIKSNLAKTVEAMAIPDHLTKFGYVAAEFSNVKQIRNYLRKEKNWTQKELYAYSYWKAGVAEDTSQKERRLEKEA